MKILFVYTDINVRGGAKSYQFGVGMLSAVLKAHGHETMLHYMFGKYDPQTLQRDIKTYRPDVLAFSAVSPQYRFVRRLLADLAPVAPFTILGGQHATLVPECLAENPELDAICVGEGEAPLLELVTALQTGQSPDSIAGLWIRTPGGQIVRNPARPFHADLDDQPFADRELFDYQTIIDSDFHTALFMFSRGCPYDCTFCSNHALRKVQTGSYVRFRSVGSCLAEIRAVTTRYRVKHLYFNDDCFTAKRSFVEELCASYQAEFSYTFDINARPETLNDALCARLHRAGCRRISIGIENGSENFRAEVLGRKQSNERIAEAFASCRRAGIKTKSFNIVGFPLETPEIARETIELNARINPDSVIVGIFEPYPGTKLAEVCRREGFVDAAREDNDFIGRTDTILNMPKFPRAEILRIFRNFGYLVYRRHSLKKAWSYRIYYSPLGEIILRLLSPLKALIRRLTMGV